MWVKPFRCKDGVSWCTVTTKERLAILLGKCMFLKANECFILSSIGEKSSGKYHSFELRPNKVPEISTISSELQSWAWYDPFLSGFVSPLPFVQATFELCRRSISFRRGRAWTQLRPTLLKLDDDMGLSSNKMNQQWWFSADHWSRTADCSFEMENAWNL